MKLKRNIKNKIMEEIIVGIFAGLGFCSSVQFVIHLIERMNKNIKSPQNKELYYWYITYTCQFSSGSFFMATNTENLKLEEIRESILKDNSEMSAPIIITNFIRVSEGTFKANKKR